MSDQRATVVVITWNRRDEVLATLDRLAVLPEQPPVIVVDNGSVDGTSIAVRSRHPGVRLVTLPRNEGAAARNAGVALAATPYVAFNDDDTWWAPGSLATAADVLDACPRLAVLTAHIRVEPGGVDDPICAEIAASELRRPPDVPGHPLLSFLAGASMVRRSAFSAAGGFEPRLFLGGEEELLGADLVSAGWAMTYLPEAVIHHQASVARDAEERLRLGIRNTMWSTWLRRPLPAALRRSAWMLRRFPAAPVTVRGLAAAAGGAPMVHAWRRPVPPAIDDGLRTLERQQRRSTARRYRVAPGGDDRG
ncbi:MAG TPA: glycosyltransferase [Acidimicrobiales bacterium]|nr:glycosyltransferase [Acidimicrobiales bacterium]